MPLLRRRRPLLRAAAVGGGAYFAGKRHAEAQEQEAYQNQRLGDLENQPAAAPAAAPARPAGGASGDAIERLTQLGKLHEQGILTDEEFAIEKQKVLAG